jgi:dienelactone hydrolase
MKSMLSISLRLAVVAACLSMGGSLRAAGFPEFNALSVQPEMPDPLTLTSGAEATTKDAWTRKRRPELKALFQHFMYGELPPKPPGPLKTSVDHTDPQLFGGKATLKLLTIHLGPGGAPSLPVLLVVPNQRKGPVPAFVGINFCGNHQLLDDPHIPLPTGWVYDKYPGVTNNRATTAGRGGQKDVWALEQSIDRGYAVAVFYNGDIDPDRADVAEGIHAFDLKTGRRKPASEIRAHDRGSVAAWAWGAQRVVDYLVTDRQIDAKRIAVVGHSRNGKAALVAAAFDERIALAIPHQAGCGGTAPSRGKVGESVKQINDHFPHWFNAGFKKFNEQPERLPLDQHCLVALTAPRPVLFSNAEEDTWANPAGQFEMLRAAEPVYRLLGAEGMSARQMPASGKLMDSTLGFYIRPGKHSMTREDWKVFLDFADRHFARR